MPTEPDLSLLPLLSDVVSERDPGCVPIPMLNPGYTDARYVSKLGIQTYGFLPMRLPRQLGMSLDPRRGRARAGGGDRVRCRPVCVDVIDRYR